MQAEDIVRVRRSGTDECLGYAGKWQSARMTDCGDENAAWLPSQDYEYRSAAAPDQCLDVYDPDYPQPFAWGCNAGSNQRFPSSPAEWRGWRLSVLPTDATVPVYVRDEGEAREWIVEPWVRKSTGPSPAPVAPGPDVAAALLYEPEDEALAAAVSSYVSGSARRRRLATDAVLDAVKADPDTFPVHGTVARSDDYAYVTVDDGGAYVERISRVLDAIERGYGIDALVSPHAGDWEDYAVVPPPSPAGTHVTLAGYSPPSSLIGTTARFSLRGLATYGHEAAGIRPSGFDPHLYPYAWYVIYVDFTEPAAFVRARFSDRPHISVGVLARRQ